jgi:hypothetical protein
MGPEIKALHPAPCTLHHFHWVTLKLLQDGKVPRTTAVKILEFEIQASTRSPHELNLLSDLELLSFHSLGEELNGGILEKAETALAVFDVQLHQLIQASATQEI